MTYFIRSGNQFDVSVDAALAIRDVLPVGNYIVKERPMGGPLFLELVDGFKPLKKLYGNTTRHAGRIINTYRDRGTDRKSTRLHSSHITISYAGFCLKKKIEQYERF